MSQQARVQTIILSAP